MIGFLRPPAGFCKRWIASAALGWLLLLGYWPLAAQPVPTARDSFDAASEAFAAGDYVRALTWFEAARDAGAEGPAVHYNIGVCQYKLGEYRRAEATFRLVAERFPEMRELAEYNLGLSLVDQGRSVEARRVLERAQAGNDRTIAGLARAMLERLEPRAPQPEQRAAWTRFVDFAIGHDDNVALVEEASLPAGQSTGSAFTELFGFASREVRTRTPLRLDFSGYVVRYPDAELFDQNAAHLGALFHWAPGSWRLEAGPHYNYSSLDGDGFEQRLGVSLRFTRPLGEGLSIEVRAGHDAVEELDQRFSFVRGTRDQVRVGVARRSERDRWRASFELERNDRAGASVSPNRSRLSIDYGRSISPRWALDFGVAYRASRYRELEQPRDEDLLDAFASARRDLPAGWLLSAELRVADNDATNSFFTYARRRLAVGVSKSF
jgi:tetratricopeptide (TPR) repeat protein